MSERWMPGGASSSPMVVIRGWARPAPERAPREVLHDDLPARMRAEHLGLAPAFPGAGTRVMIFKPMLAGLPVVAQPKGAEGLAVRPGVDCLGAEDEGVFSVALQRVLQDSTLADTLGLRGCEITRLRNDWTAILRSCGLRNADPA